MRESQSDKKKSAILILFDIAYVLHWQFTANKKASGHFHECISRHFNLKTFALHKYVLNTV